MLDQLRGIFEGMDTTLIRIIDLDAHPMPQQKDLSCICGKYGT